MSENYRNAWQYHVGRSHNWGEEVRYGDEGGEGDVRPPHRSQPLHAAGALHVERRHHHIYVECPMIAWRGRTRTWYGKEVFRGMAMEAPEQRVLCSVANIGDPEVAR